MFQKFEINAELREQSGTTVMRRLRRKQNKIPGIIYGGNEAPQSIMLSHQTIKLALENEAIFSHILKLKLNGQQHQVVLKHVQRHAYQPKILHVDFQRVCSTEKMNVTVPFHFLNEETSPGIKAGGIVSHHLTEIEINCLPSDLPEFINVDIGHLQVGEALHLSDLKLPSGVSLASLSELDERHNKTVVSIHLHRGSTAGEEESESSSAEGSESSSEEESAS